MHRTADDLIRRLASEAGAFHRAARVEECAEEFARVVWSPHDTADVAREKDARRQEIFAGVHGTLMDQIAGQAMTTQMGVYCGPTDPLNGQQRAWIQVAGRETGIRLGHGLSHPRLTIGQRVWLAQDASEVVSAEPDLPRGGETRRILRVEENGWAQVEETGGIDRRQWVRVSGYLDGVPLRVGAGVRVLDGFAYEVDPTFVERQSFLDECEWKPDGRVTFDDVIGQADAVRDLRQIVDMVAHADRYPGSELLGNMQRLLSGSPGNGKTLLWQCLANELHAALPGRFKAYLVRASSVKDKFVGNSEKNSRVLFDQPRKDFKERGIVSVLGFEEFEAIAGDRGGMFDNTSVSQGIVTTLLSYLDGVEPLDGVIILAMTNFMSQIDEALVRPGRLGGDALIEVRRLGPDAVETIVVHDVRRAAHATDGSPPEAFADAVEAALALTYGKALVGNDNEPREILGKHLTSGAAASDAVRAGLRILHRHVFAMRSIATPFDRLTPAHVYAGAVRTTRGVLSTLTGQRNLGRARNYFAGDLIDHDDPDLLKEVVPIDRFPPPPEKYDLEPMFELERQLGG